MTRLRIGLVCVTSMIAAGFLPVVLAGGGVAGAAGDPSVEDCAGHLSGSTYTLTANCDTTVSLTVPDGVTAQRRRTHHHRP